MTYTWSLYHFSVPPPLIAPLTRKVTIGENTTVMVNTTFSGGAFQWQFNGSNIMDGDKYSGTTTSILTITNIQQEDEGNYTCIATTSFGVDVTSLPAQLEVCKYKTVCFM